MSALGSDPYYLGIMGARVDVVDVLDALPANA